MPLSFNAQAGPSGQGTNPLAMPSGALAPPPPIARPFNPNPSPPPAPVPVPNNPQPPLPPQPQQLPIPQPADIARLLTTIINNKINHDLINKINEEKFRATAEQAKIKKELEPYYAKMIAYYGM